MQGLVGLSEFASSDVVVQIPGWDRCSGIGLESGQISIIATNSAICSEFTPAITLNSISSSPT
jgi:hypothetical protein